MGVRSSESVRKGRVEMTTQPRARSTDPQTSHDAAKKVRGVSAVHSTILMILWQRGPLTDPQIAEYYFQRVADGSAPMHSESGLRTRRKELVDMGKVTTAAWKEKLSTGRYATVWAWEPRK